ncbi:MAG: hypothetical protein JXB30_04955, partial [Anaerolineae bacterium]|nr:hypothetical protein [Anaerolineae bacterium]
EEFLLRAEQEGEAAFPDPLALLEEMESEELEVAEVAPDSEAIKANAETDTLDEVPLDVGDAGHGQEVRRGKPTDGLATAFALPDDEEPKTLW